MSARDPNEADRPEVDSAETRATTSSRRRFPWRRFARWIVLGGIAGWGAGAWGLHRYGLRDLHPTGDWDAIIVLGCRVFPDGQPSFALYGRVQVAAELYAEGQAPQVVLTGGVGDAGLAEAEVAATVAESLGVPRSAMVLETQSHSTEQNARFAAEATDARRVLVVTDAYHVLRSERVFARYFDQVRGVGTVNPRWISRVQGALREVAALASYGVQGRL